MAIPGAIKWDKAISVSTAHWLPVKLGKASRFESNEDASKFIGSEAHDSEELCTTMRGRLLRGFKYILPEGYAALSLLQTTEEVNRETASSIYHDSMGIDEEDDSDENGACHMVPSVKRKPPGKNWTAVHSSPSITLWGHDTAPTRVDPGRRALDFLTVADKVHTPVTPEQVAEKLRLIQAQ